MKKLTIEEKNFPAIQAELDAAYGKIEKTVSVKDLVSACRNDFPLRLMAGAVRTITAEESLAKAYKYKKEIGVAKIQHDGKKWFFVTAYRDYCYAGQSVGGIETVYPELSKTEIVDTLLKYKNISFR
jgi:hypothetical protein